jgi:hypothetical protein
MSRFKVYSPDQAYLLPPSVRDELGERHLCFFVRDVVERLDMRVFEQSYSAQNQSTTTALIDGKQLTNTQTPIQGSATSSPTGGYTDTVGPGFRQV